MVVAATAVVAAQSQAPGPSEGSLTGPSITVVAQDHHYDGLPTSLPVGSHLRLSNSGAEVHQMIVARRVDGVTETWDELLADPDPAKDRYAPLAKVLLDDQLYLNSAKPGSVYLGVEAEVVGAAMPGQGAGGGRQPGDDVIARSYSVLAAGALSGIDDGVDKDDTTPDPRTFPFLAPPQ